MPHIMLICVIAQITLATPPQSEPDGQDPIVVEIVHRWATEQHRLELVESNNAKQTVDLQEALGRELWFALHGGKEPVRP